MGVESKASKIKWKIQTIRLSEEDLKRLDEIGEKRYRIGSRAGIIRLLIEDGWEAMKYEAAK